MNLALIKNKLSSSFSWLPLKVQIIFKAIKLRNKFSHFSNQRFSQRQVFLLNFLPVFKNILLWKYLIHDLINLLAINEVEWTARDICEALNTGLENV